EVPEEPMEPEGGKGGRGGGAVTQTAPDEKALGCLKYLLTGESRPDEVGGEGGTRNCSYLSVVRAGSQKAGGYLCATRLHCFLEAILRRTTAIVPKGNGNSVTGRKHRGASQGGLSQRRKG